MAYDGGAGPDGDANGESSQAVAAMDTAGDAVHQQGEPAWKVAKDEDGKPIKTAVNAEL